MTTYQLGRQPARMGFMNIVVARAVKPLAICAGLLMLFAAASAAHASSPDPVADVIRAAPKATSAEVYIVPMEISPPVPLNEDQVRSYGCGYAVNQSKLSELLAIIDKATIKKTDIRQTNLDLHVLIRLHNSNGVVATLGFKKFPMLEDGRVHGLVNGANATAAADLPEHLRGWVTGLAPPTQRIT